MLASLGVMLMLGSPGVMMMQPFCLASLFFCFSPPFLQYPNRFLKDLALSQTGEIPATKTCPFSSLAMFLHWPGILQGRARVAADRSSTPTPRARVGENLHRQDWGEQCLLTLYLKEDAGRAECTTCPGPVAESCWENQRQVISGGRHFQTGKHKAALPFPFLAQERQSLFLKTTETLGSSRHSSRLLNIPSLLFWSFAFAADICLAGRGQWLEYADPEYISLSIYSWKLRSSAKSH